MKTKNKALLLSFCAVLLVAASVLGTMAYLTSTAGVTNTFTIGKVSITLDEAKVDSYGEVDASSADRVSENSYKLLPGHKYTKDPIVRVSGESEDCWVFVKVENGISAYEAVTGTDYKTIAEQIRENEWTALGENVYYKSYTKNAGGEELPVFEEFKIAEDANEVSGWNSISPESTTITVTAYAIQKDGLDVNAAWTAVSTN